MFVLRRGKSYGKTPSFTCNPGELCELGRGTARRSTSSGSTWSGAANQRADYASTDGDHATRGYNHTANEYDRAADADYHQGCRPDYHATSVTDEPGHANHARPEPDTRYTRQHATWNTTWNGAGNDATRHAAWHTTGHTRKSADAYAGHWMCSLGWDCERHTGKSGWIDSGNAWFQRAYRLNANNAR